MTDFILMHMQDLVDWQCCYEAAGHAQEGEVITVSYEVGESYRTYEVVTYKNRVAINRIHQEGKH